MTISKNLIRNKIHFLFLLIILSFFSDKSLYALTGNGFVDSVYSHINMNIDHTDYPYKWPPQLEIIKNSNINAYVGRLIVSGKEVGFKISISQNMLDKIVSGNDSRLAFILSHELAHIILKHTTSNDTTSNLLALKLFDRKQELESDRIALKFLIKSGFSFKQAVATLLKLKDNNDFCAIEEIGSDHPSYYERLENIDASKKDLWRSMESFEMGTYFLGLKDYEIAGHCFSKVLDEFNDCYEAYNNLGYARLLQYLGNFTKQDYQKLNVGYFLTGMYYKTPKSLNDRGLRGVSDELWNLAVNDFQFALKLNKGSSIANANLGLAYLLHPSLEPKYEKANQYFTQSLQLLDSDPNVSEEAKIAIRINSVLAFKKFQNNPNDVFVEFDKIIKSSKRLFDLNPFIERDVKRVISFNKAFSIMDGKNRRNKEIARDNFYSFLGEEDSNGIWYKLGLDYYQKLCDELKIDRKNPNIRVIQTLQPLYKVLFRGIPISLGQNVDSLEPILIKSGLQKSSILERYEFYKFSNDKLEVITGDKVLGIIIKSNQEMQLVLKTNNLDPLKLEIGMKYKEFQKTINMEKYAVNSIKYDLNNTYHFIEDLGLAFKLDNKKERIKEFFITRFN